MRSPSAERELGHLTDVLVAGVDVEDRRIDEAVGVALARFGRIDVLIHESLSWSATRSR